MEIVSLLRQLDISIFDLFVFGLTVLDFTCLIHDKPKLMSEERLLLPVNVDVCLFIQIKGHELTLHMLYFAITRLRAKHHVMEVLKHLQLLLDVIIVLVILQPVLEKLFGYLILLVGLLLTLCHFLLLFLLEFCDGLLILKRTVLLFLSDLAQLLAVEGGALDADLIDDAPKFFDSVLLRVISLNLLGVLS